MFVLKNQQALTRRGAQTIQSASRGFAGGGAKTPAIDSKETNFDIVFVGKLCNHFHQDHTLGSMSARNRATRVSVDVQKDFITNEMCRWYQRDCSDQARPDASPCP